MPTSEVAKSQWAEFLNEFVRKHEHWLAYVELIDKTTGTVKESRLLRLNGISVEGNEEPLQIVIVGETENSKVSQLVRHPEKISLSQNALGADTGVEIKTGE